MRNFVKKHAMAFFFGAMLLCFQYVLVQHCPTAHAAQNVDSVKQFVLSDNNQAVSSLPDLLDNMRTRYEAMQSLTASFHQELRHRDSGSTQINEGQLQWRKPLLVRWEVLGANAELFIVEQSSIWNYFPDEELAYRYPLDLVENSMDIINVVTGQSPLEEDFSVIDEGVENREDGRRLARLHLYPHEPAQNFTEAILWLDIKSHLIERVLIYDFYGNENDVTFYDVTPDAPVTDEVVRFLPPEGTEIIDQRSY